MQRPAAAGAGHPAHGWPTAAGQGLCRSGASLTGSRRAGWRGQALGRLVLRRLELAASARLTAARLALLAAGRPNAGRLTQGACLSAKVNVQPGCQVMRGGHGLRMQDNSYKVNRQTIVPGHAGTDRALELGVARPCARPLPVRWNYASRRSVALLRRPVITMLSVISKNLIVAAYIQPGGWVACKVSRAAQGHWCSLDRCLQPWCSRHRQMRRGRSRHYFPARAFVTLRSAPGYHGGTRR